MEVPGKKSIRMSSIRFDSHLHLGKVYYGKRAKSEQVFSVDEAIGYFDKEKVTHCNAFYLPECKSDVEILQLHCKTKVYPYKWISKFDGDSLERFDPDFDKGVKLHPIRTHNGEKRDLLSKEVFNYLTDLPPYTPVVVHTQDCRFEKDTSFYNVMRLAQELPYLKFVIAHAGSAGPASRLPSQKILKERTMDGLKYIGTNIVDSALIYGALQCSYLMKNVYCDLSSLVPNSLKLQILAQNPHFLEKVMLGADKPFFKKVGIKEEESYFRRFLGYTQEDLNKLHQRALDWLYKDKLNLSDYGNCNFNLSWVNDVVRTPKRWVYQPRAKK